MARAGVITVDIEARTNRLDAGLRGAEQRTKESARRMAAASDVALGAGAGGMLAGMGSNSSFMKMMLRGFGLFAATAAIRRVTGAIGEFASAMAEAEREIVMRSMTAEQASIKMRNTVLGQLPIFGSGFQAGQGLADWLSGDARARAETEAQNARMEQFGAIQRRVQQIDREQRRALELEEAESRGGERERLRVQRDHEVERLREEIDALIAMAQTAEQVRRLNDAFEKGREAIEMRFARQSRPQRNIRPEQVQTAIGGFTMAPAVNERSFYGPAFQDLRREEEKTAENTKRMATWMQAILRHIGAMQDTSFG